MTANFAKFTVANVERWAEVVDNFSLINLVDLVIHKPVLFIAWTLIVHIINSKLTEQVQLFGRNFHWLFEENPLDRLVERRRCVNEIN